MGFYEWLAQASIANVLGALTFCIFAGVWLALLVDRALPRRE